jgi:hypothetical protein
MTSFEDYRVLLYYHYVPIEDPQAICDWQISLCANLDLKGRIRVAREGLNGTLGTNHRLIYITLFQFWFRGVRCFYPTVYPGNEKYGMSSSPIR